MITRRQALAGAAAVAILPGRGFANPAEVLEARTANYRVVPGDYPETAIWGFNGSVPGPEIRVAQGATVRRTLRNSLTQATAVHWHGLRIENAMDGVPGLTQDAVPAGAGFTYEFTPPDAGTYWYHSHNRSTEQVARGMYGLLIVQEAAPPDVDRDIAVVIDDWRLTQEAQIVEEFGGVHDISHAGRLGNFIGARLSPETTTVKQNERMRLRLVNTATDRIMRIGLRGMAGHIVALDGMPLARPESADRVLLGPAQRADFIVDVTEEPGAAAAITIHERDEVYTLAAFGIDGLASKAVRAAPAKLAPNPVDLLKGVSGARNVPLRMEGGAMGGLREGVYKDQTLSFQDLAERGQMWTFNGIAGLPPAPMTTADKGEILRIPMRNDTAFPHAMHLHGHHFQEVLGDGTLGPLRDTLLVDRDETREIAFRADNPGDWLLHCHMLSHQAAGMTTWIRVRA